MYRVHPASSVARIRTCQPRAGLDRDVVLEPVVPLEVAMAGEAGTLGPDVLDQGATEDHVQHLETAADAEHRTIECHGGAHQVGLVAVPHPIAGPLGPNWGLAVALRCHV